MTDHLGERPPRRSLFSLIGSLPNLVGDLIRSELEQLKAELVSKLKQAGIGIGLVAGAAVFGLFTVGVFIAAAILGIAVALPAWLAALIVAVALLLVTGVLLMVGVSRLKRGTPPTPTKTVNSVKRDIRVIKGTGRRETP